MMNEIMRFICSAIAAVMIAGLIAGEINRIKEKKGR